MSPAPEHGETSEQRQVSAQVALVIVTHNSASVLKTLLPTLSAERSVFSEIIFVDNASIDPSTEMIQHEIPSARVIRNTANRGFAAGVNEGVQATSAPFVLVSNPDVRWTSQDVELLTQFLESHHGAAAVCPRLNFPDGRQQKSVRRFPTHANIWFSRQSPLRALLPILPSGFSYTLPDPPTPSSVQAVAATFMLVRRAAFHSVTGMDAGYFLYVEDTDLCKRWHDAGFEVWMDTDVTVIHDWQGGSGKDPILRRHHRNGIRRYFRIHHADKPVRNSLLFGLLDIMNWWDRLRHGHRGLHVE